jgi:acyl carrier protein
MQKAKVIQDLKQYLICEVLDGNDIGLDEHTPLLAWSIINSLEMVRLLTFIDSRFGVEIPSDDLIAENFTDLTSITNLIFKKMIPASQQ